MGVANKKSNKRMKSHLLLTLLMPTLPQNSTGLPIVALNFPIIFTVTDGQTGNPVAGATVKEATTDANRKVSVIFTQVGAQEVKATKPGARSNQITIHVFP